MSAESAAAFVERMRIDGEFADKVAACSSEEEKRALLQAEGFDFTDEELEEEEPGLSIDDLEIIAGGIPTIPPVNDPTGLD